MGLPLYRAPVESDIKGKVPKDPPTRARSTIRRTTRQEFHSSTPRFYHRRRPRLSPGSEQTPWSTWDDAPGVAETTPLRSNTDARSRLRRATTLNDAPVGPPDTARPLVAPFHERERERQTVSRSGMSQEMARYFGEHMAMLHAATSSRPHTESPSEGEDPVLVRSERWSSSRRDRPASPRESTWSYSRQIENANDLRPSDPATVRMNIAALHRMRVARAARTPVAAGDASQPRSQAQSPVDGLGDRNRSLSPEDEGVWDTLLSSITPDPQPPSVGTSFASTGASASGSTSQTTDASAHSSLTNTTAPTTIDALEFDMEDNPCEENSDTEGEDDDYSQLTLRRFGRSYADVTRSQREDDDLEIMGGVESMQRIVRNLARREDIPDEWWADAGLSRSLQTRREAA